MECKFIFIYKTIVGEGLMKGFELSLHPSKTKERGSRALQVGFIGHWRKESGKKQVLLKSTECPKN
jgi:hypothetical protein